MGKIIPDITIKHHEKSDRDFSVIKICETCGLQYYPRKNGYQATSRYCSAECSRGSRNIR